MKQKQQAISERERLIKMLLKTGSWTHKHLRRQRTEKLRQMAQLRLVA